MLFYQFFSNRLYANYQKKCKYLNIYENLSLFTAPKIFHYPRLRITMSLPPKINKTLLNKVRYSNQFRSVYSWSKPTLFVKNSRLLFLYYFFLKNNNKSLSTIFIKLKKFKTSVIVAFFMKTVGYVLDIFFKTTLSPGLTDFVVVNLAKVTGNWYQIKSNSIVQLIWCSSLIRQNTKSNVWYGYSTISLDASHANLTYNTVSGVVDYRTNSLFLTSVKEPSQKNLNFLNLNVTSVYNWKIII